MIPVIVDNCSLASRALNYPWLEYSTMGNGTKILLILLYRYVPVSVIPVLSGKVCATRRDLALQCSGRWPTASAEPE